MHSSKPKTPQHSIHRNKLEDNTQEVPVRQLLRKRLRRFTFLISKATQSEKPKAIHDIRVASRRLQQILDFIFPSPRPPTIRRLRSRIRRSRRALGKVRDYDVFIAFLDNRSKSKKFMPAPALTKLLKLLSKRRTKSMLKAHAEFQKIDILDLCTQLRTLLSTLEQQAKTTGFTKLPTEFRQRPTGITLNKLRRDLASEITKSLQGQRQMNIHRVRIKAKRLRYLLEVVEELGYPDVDLHLMWLRRLQHYLGSWHDLEVQEKIVLKMLSRRTIAKDSAQFEPLTGMVRKMRVVKYDIEEAYLKQVREGDELERLQLWIKSHFEDTT